VGGITVDSARQSFPARVLAANLILASGAAADQPWRGIVDRPPLTPEAGETVIPAEVFMTKACGVRLEPPSKQRPLFGRPVLTTSARWGKVWRIDFAMPGGDLHGVINRAVCFSPPGQPATMEIALGRNVAPLPQ
jgi:hypothetical protein